MPASSNKNIKLEQTPRDTESGAQESSRHEQSQRPGREQIQEHGREQNRGDLETKIQAQHKKILQLIAEIDNLQKKHHQDLSRSRYTAIKDFALDVCTSLDSIDAAMESIKPEDGQNDDESKWTSMVQGLFFIKKSMLNTLSKYRVELMSTEGQVFNPRIHEALQQIPHGSPSGTIVRTIRSGYMLDNQLLRPAQVIISAGPESLKHRESGS